MEHGNRLASTRHEESLSLHWYITFDISTTITTPVHATPKRWNWRKLDHERLSEHLEMKITAGFGVTDQTESLTNALDAYLVAACNASMAIKSYHGGKKPVYWWTREIVELRKTAFAARRKLQRARKRRGPDACIELEQVARETLKTLRMVIKESQEESWKSLCQMVDNDPWGLPYRIVTKKLIGRRKIPGLSLPGRLQEIIHSLFPTRLRVEWQIPPESDLIEPVTYGDQ